MESKTARQMLHELVDTLEDNKVEHIIHYATFEINYDSDWQYTDEFIAKLEERTKNYEKVVNTIPYDYQDDKPPKQRLHLVIDLLDNYKVEKVYLYVTIEMNEDDDWEFTDEFMEELDRRSEDYKNGKKMVSADEVKRDINDLLNRLKKDKAS